MKNENEKSALQQMVEETAFADGLRSYSGRGMHGKRCLGIDIDRAEQPPIYHQDFHDFIHKFFDIRD